MAACPIRGCPVRYTSGRDRLCAEHQRDDAVTEEARRSFDYAARQRPDGIRAIASGVSATSRAADAPGPEPPGTRQRRQRRGQRAH